MAKIKLTDLIKESGTNVKSLGTGKMQHANTRTNLGRHRSSDILDKQSSREHEKNTVKGLKAANYLPPHMREEEMDEAKYQDAIVPIKQTMHALGYKGEYDPTIIEGYIFTKDLGDGVMEITLTNLYDDEEKFTFAAYYLPRITQSKFFGLLKKKVLDYKNGKLVSDDVEHVDLGTGMFSLDKPGVENLIKSMVSKVEAKANTKSTDEMEEGSAFDYAALQAKKHHEKSFTVGGKKFPVKEVKRMSQLAGIKKTK